MNYPYIDIHSHNATSHATPEKIVFYSYRLGSDLPLPTHPFSAGIHPWDAGENLDTSLLLSELQECEIDAVGEIGLDYSRGLGDAAMQENIFRSQLGIAVEKRLPVIIHCVKAFEQAMHILQDYPSLSVIFHGYIGSPQQTERVAASGYCVSVGNASFRSSKTIASLRILPKNLLFLETDATEMPIENVYSAASKILETPITRLKRLIYENFKSLFPTL